MNPRAAQPASRTTSHPARNRAAANAPLWMYFSMSVVRFSGLYQWKLSLASEGEDDTVSGKDLDVRGYQLVIGRRLGN